MKQYENLDLFLKKLTTLSKKHDLYLFSHNSCSCKSKDNILIKNSSGAIIADKLFYIESSYYAQDRECISSERQNRTCCSCHQEHKNE